MSETPVIYTSLPEDLEPVLKNRVTMQVALSVRINKKYIGISRAAHEALGKPRRLEILFGPVSRMLALRAVADGGRVVTPNGISGLVQLQADTFITSLKLPPIAADQRNSHHFTPRLVEGALLIGPLPKAEGSDA